MSEQYIWLMKNDPALKEYEAKGWHNIVTIKDENQDVYFCFASDKAYFSGKNKNKILAPMCIREIHESDFLLEFKEISQYGFVWQKNRCFSLDNRAIKALKNSSQNIFKEKDIFLIDSADKLIEAAAIRKETAIDMHPMYFFVVIILVVGTLISGLFLW